MLRKLGLWLGGAVVLAVVVIMMMRLYNQKMMAAVAKDDVIARQVVAALYNGSLNTAPVAHALDPILERSLPASLMRPISDLLRQYGEVSHVELRSTKPIQSYFREAVWTVLAERGSFEMKLSFNSHDLITGIWLREGPAHEWISLNDLVSAWRR